MKNDYLVVQGHIPIGTARKDICYGTKEPYEGEEDQVSEWAMAVALGQFKIGDKVTKEDFAKEVHNACIGQTLSDLVDKGLVSVS